MGLARNALALLGLLTLLLAALGVAVFARFDRAAPGLYGSMLRDIVATGNPAEAMVWKRRVADGLSFEDVDLSIQSLAADLNMKDVGALPLGDQVAAMKGQPWRQLKVYLFCNPLTAAKMVEYSPAYAAWLPCRVSLVEDASGGLWLYALNMDVMLHGGTPLPTDLADEAEGARDAIFTLLDKAASGDF